MARWSIEVYDITGKHIANLNGMALVRKISKVRNRADVIDLKFDLDAIKRLCIASNTTAVELLAINQNEIRMKRNGVVVSAGQICYRLPVINEDERTIQLKAVGWLDILGTRELDEAVRFEATDAGQIAWALIDTAQQRQYGDMGITEGYIQASMPRDRSYESRKNIKEAIVQLTEVDKGFDHEITWDKKYNVYYPKIGQRKPTVKFTYPGNIRGLSFASDGMQMANEVTARGAGTGEDAFKATEPDEVSQQKFWLRQRTIDYSDIVLVDTLREHATEELSFSSRFLDIPDIILDEATAPAFGSYGIGDEVPVEVTEDIEIFGSINDYFRIDAMDITLDENDAEEIRLRMMR